MKNPRYILDNDLDRLIASPDTDPAALPSLQAESTRRVELGRARCLAIDALWAEFFIDAEEIRHGSSMVYRNNGFTTKTECAFGGYITQRYTNETGYTRYHGGLREAVVSTSDEEALLAALRSGFVA